MSGRQDPQSFLGRFLVSEIENRIERISGRKIEKSVRAKTARTIASAIGEAAYVNNVDPFLLLSMIEVESRYNQRAVGGHGEIGLMQIKPSTAKWVSKKRLTEFYGCDLFEVRCNIMMGAAYVSHLHDRTEKRKQEDESRSLQVHTRHDFREYVLRSYNLGPARTDRMALAAPFKTEMSDRLPAADPMTAGAVGAVESSPKKVKIPYAAKISRRAASFKSRYLVAATETNKPVQKSRLPMSTRDDLRSVAMIQ